MLQIGKREIVLTLCPGVNASGLGPCYYYFYGYFDDITLKYFEETESVIQQLYHGEGSGFAKVFADADLSKLNKAENDALSVYNSRVNVLNSRCYTRKIYMEKIGALHLQRIKTRSMFLSGDYKFVDTVFHMPFTTGPFDLSSTMQPVYLLFLGPFPENFDSWLQKVSKRFIEFAGNKDAKLEDKIEGAFKVLDYCGEKLNMFGALVPKEDLDWLNRQCHK